MRSPSSPLIAIVVALLLVALQVPMAFAGSPLGRVPGNEFELASPSPSPLTSSPSPAPSDPVSSVPETTTPITPAPTTPPPPTPTPTPAPTPEPTRFESPSPSLSPSPSPSIDPTPATSAQVLSESSDATPHLTLRLDGRIGYSLRESTVLVDAAGLEPNSFVRVVMRSDPILIASFVVSATGEIVIVAPLTVEVAAGNHSISVEATTAAGSGLPSESERVIALLVDGENRLLAYGSDARPEPLPTGSPTAISSPVAGRGGVQIVVDPEQTTIYIDERVSTSAISAGIGSAQTALVAPRTLSTGVVATLILMLLSIMLEYPIKLLQERVKSAYLALRNGLVGDNRHEVAVQIAGVRPDVILFLIAGQVIVQLNAPLEQLPGLSQLALGAVLGAIGVAALSFWYALPSMYAHLRLNRDRGDLRAEWPSLLLALMALVGVHLLGIVPGIIVGLFMVRTFKTSLPQNLTAKGVWYAVLGALALSLVSWFVLDVIYVVESDTTATVRVIADGLLGFVVVAGSHGALMTLLDPGNEGVTLLRRLYFWRWVIAVGAAATITCALLLGGSIDTGLITPPQSLGEYLALLAFIAVMLLAITQLQRRAERLRGAP